MKKIVTQIRDILHIEKELHNDFTGVLAFNLKDEELVQLTITFLYQDKNIYFFLDVKQEMFENIKFENSVSFTVLKAEKMKKNIKIDFTPVYNTLSITISGLLKKVDDDKLLAEVKKNYLKKYTAKGEEREKSLKLGNAVFIDTEEIQAFEEAGG